jgi:hypothetical protein
MINNNTNNECCICLETIITIEFDLNISPSRSLLTSNVDLNRQGTENKLGCCNNYIHKKCIDELLNTNSFNNCPLCRSKFDTVELNPAIIKKPYIDTRSNYERSSPFQKICFITTIILLISIIIILLVFALFFRNFNFKH